jgi:diguanylate cyclase (GGDEF)-like protein
MPLDIPTLFIVATCVAALLGLFLFFTWLGDRDTRALAWWGGAYLMGGLGIALWIADAVVSPPLPYGIANALLFVACGMIWSGARLFHGRDVQPLALSAGAALWLIACQFADFANSGTNRAILSTIIVSAYTFFSARELWRDRRKPSRWAAVLVPVLHGMVFLPAIPLAFMRPEDQGDSYISSGWMAVFTLETLLYAVGTAFVVLTMAKDRREQMHRTAAATDTLTGLRNRRGFLSDVQTLLLRQPRTARVSVLMFDLDHFKGVNDRYGHAVGDAALKLFANTITASMREKDIIGRLGGEEFAALVPGGPAEAAGVAERVRAAFEIAGVEVDGHPLRATVSIGLATGPVLQCNVEQMLSVADAALYRAKANGRNRVEAAEVVNAPPPMPAAKPSPGIADGAAAAAA